MHSPPPRRIGLSDADRASEVEHTRRVTVFLDLAASDFTAPFASLNGTRRLRTSRRSLLRALVTVGHLPTFALPLDTFRSEAIRMRLALGRAHITVRGTGAKARFAPSDEWLERTEATEQAFVSYFLGSALAKLVAARLFRTPHLLHTSMYASAGVQFDPLNPRRPDFIGPRNDGGTWTVVEAKGRKRRSASVVSSAKEQARAIAMINGAAPSLAVASIALFHRSEVSMELVDPPANPRGLNLQITTATALRLYYQPILELLGDDARAEAMERDVVIREIPGLDLRIGLTSAILNQFSSDFPFEDLPIRRLQPAQDARVRARLAAPDVDLVGSDGVLIDPGPSWWPAVG